MQLRQVFMNLILNAVDAMKDGGSLGIKTRFDDSNLSVRVELSDTGRGIDSAVMGKLFQPFFTTKSKGTGLGLAISKRLIEDHGGKISIEQNSAGGATFIITLPATPSERVRMA
jgi:signal transduction histidine kinase